MLRFIILSLLIEIQLFAAIPIQVNPIDKVNLKEKGEACRVRLIVSGKKNQQIAYLKFSTDFVKSSDEIDEIKLLLPLNEIRGSGIVNISWATQSWSEDHLNWYNKPVAGEWIGGYDVSSLDNLSTLEIDLTESLKVRGYDGDLCFVIETNDPLSINLDSSHFFGELKKRLKGIESSTPHLKMMFSPMGGPQGEVGPVGPVGAQGEVGPIGPAGAQGEVGPVGPAGVQGEVGPIGPAGVQGEVGPVGPAGAQGEVGPIGSAGVQGDVGPIGPVGVQGEVGLIGPAGAQGEVGPTGPTGAQGDVGPIGPAGAQGDVGPTGPAGAQGEVGPVGPVGVQGEVGPVGPAGAQGEVGPIGPAGAQGDIGPIGPAGAQGDIGQIGPTGAQGDIGPTGTQGETGLVGATGPKGDVGPMGPQGPAGESSSDISGGMKVIGLITQMGMATTNSASYVDVANRTLSFTKQKDSSYIRIMIDDVIGTSVAGSGLVQASWRLTIDGVAIGRAKHIIESQNSGLHLESKLMLWNVFGLSAGTHEVKLQAKLSGATLLIHGNPEGEVENVIEVTEVNQ